MSNLAITLRNEVRQILRKELGRLNKSGQRAKANQQAALDSLAKQNANLVRRIKVLERQSGSASSAESEQLPKVGFKFSAKWIREHREKLDISAANYAKLAGVSMLTIYNWEHGKSKPRHRQLVALDRIRNLSTAAALKELEKLG